MIRSLQSTFFILLAFVSLACSVPSGPAGKPAVGITYGAIQTRLLKCGIDINGEYIEALKAQGAYAVRIFVNDDQAAVRQKLASLDGVLIPGGFDIEPSRYGEERDAACEAVDEKLDALEYTVLVCARTGAPCARHLPWLPDAERVLRRIAVSGYSIAVCDRRAGAPPESN